jgi:hypothetical protein
MMLRGEETLGRMTGVVVRGGKTARSGESEVEGAGKKGRLRRLG